ncbi:MAG: right-handed parallel beta-helix repeat-containing protein, partial [Bacteroidota bacterium]
DYPNFTAATDDLKLRGIDAAVCFNVQPGTYAEDFSLTAIAGVSASNTISFIGENKETVIIEAGTIVGDGMIELTDVDHLSFSQITFSGNAGSLDNTFAIIADNCNHLTINDCDFRDSREKWFSYIEVSNSEGFQLSNCDFAFASGGVDLYDCKDLLIERNQFAVEYSLWLERDTNVSIQYNQLKQARSSMVIKDAEQIYIYANELEVFGHYAIDIKSTNQVNLTNNTIYSTSPEAGNVPRAAVAVEDVAELDVFHNTISAKNRALQFSKVRQADVRNNIFSVNFAVNMLFVNASSDDTDYYGTNFFDYNLYFYNTADPAFRIDAGIYESVDSWKASAPVFNQNSLMMEPVFVSTSDLRLGGGTGYNFGDPAVGVAVDIDGNTRDMTRPVTVGAANFCAPIGSTDVINSCEPITWLDGQVYNENNETAQHTLVTATGCDSIITLQFTLLSSSSTVTATGCDSYDFHGQSFTSSGSYEVTLTNAAGCDSLVTLELDMATPPSGICTPMRGCYSIGANGASDYDSFSEAVEDLTYRGIDAAVCFNVRPGVYAENFSIGNINGSSAVNTISFIGDDVETVIIEPTTTEGNAVIEIDGAQHLRFSHLTLSGNVGSIANKYGMHIGDSKNVSIDNCHFQDGQTKWFTFIVTEDCSHFDLINNRFTDPIAAFDNVRANDFLVSDNCFDGVYFGMYFYESERLNIRNNKSTNAYRTLDLFSVSGVEVYNNDFTSASSNINSNTATAVSIYNNFLRSTEANTGTGGRNRGVIHMNNMQQGSIYHNTVIGTDRGLHLTESGGNEVRNNIFKIAADRFIIYTSNIIATALDDNRFDYNLYYNDSTNFGNKFFIDETLISLEAWQMAKPGNNQHSKTFKPDFVSNDDMHIITEIGLNFGDPLVGIDNDIDGDTRDLTGPVDVGADEDCLITITETVNACGDFTWSDGQTYSRDTSTAFYVMPTTNGCDT